MIAGNGRTSLTTNFPFIYPSNFFRKPSNKKILLHVFQSQSTTETKLTKAGYTYT